uniref:Putative rep protein n=1 Tax=uncultured virus TaxID=340016 RepID=A0A1D8MJY8_9VIRU|nr:putative rep protein [uncultured virus]
MSRSSKTSDRPANTKTSRSWCFTINDANWDPKSVGEELCRYLVCQLEAAPSTGKLHYQGYCEFKNAIRMAQCKRILGNDGAHLEPRLGTRDEARDYCMKPETRVAGPFEFGNWVGGGQGKRSDLQMISKLITEGKSSKEIFELYPTAYLRNHSGIDKAVSMTRKAPEYRDVKVHIYWGSPGSGKTHAIRTAALEASKRDGCDGYYKWPANCEQPVGYNGQKHVVIEEFAGWIPASLFKDILDVYATAPKIPYCTVPWMAEEIWISSNYDPKTWYKNPVEWNAIERRCASITEFKGMHPDALKKKQGIVRKVVDWDSLKQVSQELLDHGLVPLPGTVWQKPKGNKCTAWVPVNTRNLT